MLPWLSLLPLLACGGAPVALTTATTEADALLMARVTGRWEGTTPEGPVALDLCENAARLTSLPFDPESRLTCPLVMHEVRGEGRGVTEDVDLTPQAREADQLFGSAQSVKACSRVMAAPLAARVASWCGDRRWTGALLVATAPSSAPYDGDHRLALSAPLFEGGPELVLAATLTTTDVLRLEYRTGSVCPSRACGAAQADPAHCVPTDGGVGPTTTVELHRTGAASCPVP